MQAVTKYPLPVTNDAGHFSWFNQVNGSLQSLSENFGPVELAWFKAPSNHGSALLKRGYPVGLDCGGALSPLVGASSWLNDNALPFVDYVTAANRSKFFSILMETSPPPKFPGSDTLFSKILVRVLMHGFFFPYDHGFAHMTPAYLPTLRGLPLTNVANGTKVGYFLLADLPSSAVNTGIYLNAML